MTPEQLGSWLVIASFVLAFLYLLKAQPDYSLLALAAKISTALLLCFSGLVITGLIAFAATQLKLPLNQPLILAAIVPFGTLVAIGVHYKWRSGLR